jgi:subtilisin family serine protease
MTRNRRLAVALHQALTGAVPATLLAIVLSACGTGAGPGIGAGPVQAPNQPVQLSSGDSSASFELENTADESLDWIIEVSQDSGNPQGGAWFDIEPRQGRLEPHGRQLVTLIQHRGLTAGSYRSILSVVFRGGRTNFEVVGEVEPADSSAEGDGSIGGRLLTANSDIPLRAPSDFVRSSLASIEDRSAEAARDQFLPGQLIVGLEPSARTLSAEPGESAAAALARRHGLSLLRQTEPAGAVAAPAGQVRAEATALVAVPEGVDPESAAAALATDPGVAWVEPNYIFHLHALPNDPLLGESWQLPVVGAPVAWQALASLSRMPVVAVIDSGIDLDHEDLRGVFVSDGYDFCAASNCTSRDGDPRPAFRGDTHGTHVTGLLAAIAGNGRGAAGVVAGKARVLPVKVFHEDFTTAAALAEAIRWAAGETVAGVRNPNPANIITLSLGAGSDSRTVREAVLAAQARGALIVASSGNQGESEVDYPARYPGVLGVGAVNTSFRRSCFSDYGEGLDLMAPGGDGYLCNAPRNETLLSTFPGNDYGIDAGTSMAAPLAAGAAALAWADMGSPDAELVTRRLVETAYFDSDYMSAERYGAGVVRVDRAVGFPGPGDQAAVQAVGPSTALDTVTLDRAGSSSSYLLDGLAAGRYSLEADAAGRSRTMLGTRTVDLAEGQEVTPLAIPLEP